LLLEISHDDCEDAPITVFESQRRVENSDAQSPSREHVLVPIRVVLPVISAGFRILIKASKDRVGSDVLRSESVRSYEG
jgi:hypothetical protein